MPPRFQRHVPEHLREPHEVEVPGTWNVYLIAIGIVILLGLVGGSLRIAWRLLAARFAN